VRMIRLDQQLIFKILIVAGLIFRTLDCTSDQPTRAQDAQYDQYDQPEEPYYDQFDNPGGYDYDYENSEESQYYQPEPAEPPLDQPDPDFVQQSDSAANSVDPYQGFPEESGTTWALSDEDYKISLGVEYIYFEITAPEELAYTYKANPATFAPSWPNTSYNGLGLVPTDPPCGCGYIRNHEEVEGKIALVDRGDCSFVSKVVRAEEAGAVGVVVTDDERDNDETFVSMADDTTGREVSIPAAFVLGKNGHVIKRMLGRLGLAEATVNIPINITNIAPFKLNQPPWIVW